MKKIILLALTTLMMVGCDESTENIEAPLGGNRFTTVYQTIIVDSCEYISGASRIAHKGNCRFCAERRKQELKELVEQLKEK